MRKKYLQPKTHPVLHNLSTLFKYIHRPRRTAARNRPLPAQNPTVERAGRSLQKKLLRHLHPRTGRAMRMSRRLARPFTHRQSGENTDTDRTDERPATTGIAGRYDYQTTGENPELHPSVEIQPLGHEKPPQDRPAGTGIRRRNHPCAD